MLYDQLDERRRRLSPLAASMAGSGAEHDPMAAQASLMGQMRPQLAAPRMAPSAEMPPEHGPPGLPPGIRQPPVASAAVPQLSAPAHVPSPVAGLRPPLMGARRPQLAGGLQRAPLGRMAVRRKMWPGSSQGQLAY